MMRAQGPVHGSALVASRRPIGTGARAVAATDPARIVTRRVTHVERPKRPMKRRAIYRASLFAIALGGAALGIGASIEAPPTLMSPAQHLQARKAIEAESRLALARCRDAAGIEKDVCKAAAAAEDRVKKAELDARYYGTVDAERRVQEVRGRAAYEIARARCGAYAGAERVDCLRAAREERGRGIADGEPKPSSTRRL